MNKNEVENLAKSSGILAKSYPSPWTPLAVFLMGILCSIMGLGMALVCSILLTAPPVNRPHAQLVEDALWSGGIALVSLVGAALLFARAREGYSQGRSQVRPLSYRGQLVAACFATLVCGFMAVANALDGQWVRTPIFLLNPMLLLTWFGVAHKRAQAHSGSLTVKETLTAETKTSGHWWTRYRTDQPEDETQASIGKRS